MTTREDYERNRADELVSRLEGEGYVAVRRLDDNSVASVVRLQYTYGLCTGVSSTGYERRYCYSTKEEALWALELLTDNEVLPMPGYIAQRPERR